MLLGPAYQLIHESRINGKDCRLLALEAATMTYDRTRTPRLRCFRETFLYMNLILSYKRHNIIDSGYDVCIYIAFNGIFRYEVSMLI